MEINRISQVIAFYDIQYSNLLEAKKYIDLYPEFGYKTNLGKHEAVYDILLHNTLLMLDISVASKSLLISRELNNQIEINYFARALAVHCRDILHPFEDGITFRINALIKLFINDENKPPILSDLIQNRKIIKNYEKEHYPYFNEIRKNVFAHKLGKGIEQSEFSKNLDADNIIILSGGFFDNFIDLNRILTQILKFLNENPS